MRHYNPTSASYVPFRNGRRITVPYNKQYIDTYHDTKFALANSHKTYVKILQYIADHDGCKRADVNIDVLGWKSYAETHDKKLTAKRSSGQHSNTYAALLYLDLIDYDKHYCYRITEKGRNVLKTAYENDMLKIVNH